ncbi:phage tail fiber protein [Paenibacillus dokdonensis]|uniref:phage tail fiber protein n=1 Tax=Paenibacillus dokdonensis TaxID=2567944 RepID=UPI003D2960F8
MQISNWLSAQFLNAALRNTPFTPPSTIYLALYTSDPTAADTGQEVVGGGYTRRVITFAAPAVESGKQTVKNNSDVQFPVATANWGLVTHVGIRTAATGGNLLWSKPVDNPRTIETGDNPKFLANSTLVRFGQ